MSVESWFNHVWYDRPVPPWWLMPLSYVYGSVAAVRRRLYDMRLRQSTRLSRPVIVVGNLSVGGTGKTPLVAWLVMRLKDLGFKPGIVTRGYGGSATGVRLVVAGDDPRVVGDEAVLLARGTGAVIAAGRDRPAAANLLIQAGCDVVVSDDGLQHYALARDCEVVVIDGARRFGNGRLLPAGPLREAPTRLGSVDAIVLNLADALRATPAVTGNAFSMRLEGDFALPLASGAGRASRELRDFAGQTVHAVAGIGNPARFFDMLRQRGILVEAHAFADHAPLSAADICFPDDAPVLMTEKDAVKCAGFAGPQHWYVPIRAKFAADESDALIGVVTRAIANSRPVR